MVRAWSAWIEDLASGLCQVGIILTPEELSHHCDGFFRGSCESFENLTVYETRIRNLALRLGADPSQAWCKGMATESMDRWQSFISLDPEALPLLQYLRSIGIKIGIISNFDHYPHVHKILRNCGLSPCVDAVVVSGEVGLKKPDPAIFRLALENLQTNSSDAVFIGDHPQEDFAGAESAGLQAILLQRDGVGLDRLHINYHKDLIGGLVRETDLLPYKKGIRSLADARAIFN
jgi:putative hydrolase of the HAD superfamily